MTSKPILISAALSGFLATLFGAFGAHVLKATLTPEMLSVYQTGISYQFYHTFALLFVGLLLNTYQSKYLKLSGYMFLIGIILFTGSLLILAVTQVKVFGIITPIGGVCFLLGWGLLAVGCCRLSNSQAA